MRLTNEELYSCKLNDLIKECIERGRERDELLKHPWVEGELIFQGEHEADIGQIGVTFPVLDRMRKRAEITEKERYSLAAELARERECRRRLAEALNEWVTVLPLPAEDEQLWRAQVRAAWMKGRAVLAESRALDKEAEKKQSCGCCIDGIIEGDSSNDPDQARFCSCAAGIQRANSIKQDKKEGK